jgi:VWFA-related protein
LSGACVILAVFAAHSHNMPQEATPPKNAIAAQHVKLYITALDKQGHAITDLRLEELRVLDGKHEQKIESMNLASAEPLTVGLAVDISGSAREELRGVNWTPATQFFQQTLRAGDFGFVLAFSAELRFVSDLTSDPGVLEQAIVRLSQTSPGGATALYDVIGWTCHRELSGRSGRKVLVVVSDGADNASHASRENMLTDVLGTGATVWTVDPVSESSFPDPGTRAEWRHGAKVLEELAHHTGGSGLILRDKRELGNAFQQIAEGLRSQYAVMFLPDASVARGKLHSLKVETTRPGMIVRAPAAYYLSKK